ncbi:Hypothetical protein A7982_08633 [Minicystis rosea]|nr:Hypothetical protein A7982_08633 [Minicystis rosea]
MPEDGAPSFEEAAPDRVGERRSSDTEPTREAVQGAYESTFHFATTVLDDGQDDGGGWQVASARLKFGDWRHLPPNFWTCAVVVGMPLRSAMAGPISSRHAAQITAVVVTEATEEVMRARPRWLGEDYCIALRAKLREKFRTRYRTLGARVSPP